MQIAIIGTAGRAEDGVRLDRTSFFWMSAKVNNIIDDYLKIKVNKCRWVSGGAAWADHLAVDLFLLGYGCELTIYGPCAWDTENEQYLDTGINDWRTNPGGTSNHYHRRFSERCWGTPNFSLLQIQDAIDEGARYEAGKGFHERNTEVAKADVCIAFTFGDGPKLKDGGTADTMRKFLKDGAKRAFHVDLNDWTIYDKPIV